ncbi:MAG TPA: hypothetical protein VMB85_08985 [Bryobacteraceae bacterium]|nr:hypothetical protein [Bryobacteraceae bacterium]
MSEIAMGFHEANRSEAELFHRVSWAAIFSGVLVALATELVFLSFGMFIGFLMTGSAHAWSEAWYFFGIFCSLLVGSWVAARLAGNPNRGNGMLHGFVVWGVTMFTTAVIAAAVLWDVVRLASSFVQTALVNVPPGTPLHGNVSQLANSAAGDISTTSLVIFGGLLAAVAGSLIGGAWAAPRETNFVAEHRPNLPEQPHHA